MNKLVVSEIVDEIVETEWNLESHGSIHIVINPTLPKIHNDFFYWRLDDPEGRYLLSMDISEDGYLKMIEIITYDRRHIPLPISVKMQESPLVRSNVFVRIDTHSWMERKRSIEDSSNMHSSNAYKFIDNPEPFSFQIDKNDLRVEIFKDTIAQVIWISRFVCLELNDANEVCGIFLKSFLTQYGGRFLGNFGLGGYLKMINFGQ
jgi:hypothetical protein